MESDLSYLIALVSCLFLSAIFSMAETALTTVPETFFIKAIEQHRGFIQPFKLWLHRPNRVLTTIIVGNNLVNTMAAVVATVFAQRIFEHYVISIATGVVTILLLVFGEITPKTFARHNAQSIAASMLYLVYPIYYLFFPVVWVLSQFAVYVVQLAGGRTKRVGPVATEEDIAYLIRLSHEEGVFHPEQGQMLENVLAFRGMSVREIMVPRTDLFSLPIDASLEELLSQVTQHGYTRWPVYETDIDHVVGVFYVKDLISFQVSGRKNFVLKEHLRRAIFIPESMKLDAVLLEFQKNKAHLGVVVDEYGGTAGLITLENILEQIVGQIQDEYDKEEEEETITKLGEDHYIADGRTSVLSLQKQCGISVPADDAYETLGGFLITAFGKIPRKNAEYVHQGWKFRLVEMEEKRVVRVEILKEMDNVESRHI